MTKPTAQIGELEKIAAEMRVNIVKMMGPDKVHHFGGSLSAADLITALYFYKLNYSEANPKWPERDRFLMSKGHSVPAQYAALAMRGVFPIEELATLKRLGSRLQGHPAMHYTPGIEGCTGSLGQGLSYANGLALAGRIRGLAYHVYCLLGDGELHEGQVWEAAQDTPQLGLTKVTVLIDHNRLKAMDDSSRSAKPLGRIEARFEAFGWRVRSIDGHNMAEICGALDWATEPAEAPAAIIARTIKGKGLSFVENQPSFHNSSITAEQYQKAMLELQDVLATTQEGAR